MLGKSVFCSKFEIQEDVTKSLDHPRHKITLRFIKKEVDKLKYSRIKRDLQKVIEVDDIQQHSITGAIRRITTEYDFIRCYNNSEQLKIIFEMCHGHTSAYNQAYESCMASRNGLRAWTNKHRHHSP